MAQVTRGAHKRLIICCDGTWMDSLGKKGAEPQSNVTRISRVLRRTCQDGTHQIIMYDPGVGSSDSVVDKLTGGLFGSGLDQNIREVYNFICTNYVDGDDIILLGFSRGAFTARSVADMIATVGLLTPMGLEQFYSVFEDYEHMSDAKRDTKLYLFPNMPPYKNEQGQAKRQWEAKRRAQYQEWLTKNGYSRHTYQDGKTDITIKAVGVWDTVGTLGIPPAPVFVSDRVENAFHALALDEPRYAFRPALWEKRDNTKTNLKQVWFPGTHSSVGGGWHEQQIANISLAWMCDQLSTIGVEFSQSRMDDTFNQGLRYSAGHPFAYVPQNSWTSWFSSKTPLLWANSAICSVKPSSVKRDIAECSGKDSHPTGRKEELWKLARPWALGIMRYPDSIIQTIGGVTVRHPGLFMRADPDTNQDTDQPLQNTDESVHSSVRVRMACQGLGTDDGEVWSCKPLTRADNGSELWRIERGSGLKSSEIERIRNFKPRELSLSKDEYNGDLYTPGDGDGQWRWVLSEKQGENNSSVRVLPEEPMTGYWERHLLALTAGAPDVWRWAEDNSRQV
ncbi:peptidoglycan binding domain-containing protein [Colletotrichum truncatum]|uniref:Peptidoglycan binding domain-containing protein n=1 Tax=Colletotrichum truncatum TaxID=5467 RepID=A0ACC3Z870_COLTU|nr:peptidoglycan binding domain-containing protein [Colletotrichum truncatum]KAF6783626.1 peptidoglycan binding domain-containing protein [Colletotrichum truncatum]